MPESFPSPLSRRMRAVVSVGRQASTVVLRVVVTVDVAEYEIKELQNEPTLSSCWSSVMFSEHMGLEASVVLEEKKLEEKV
jgi:hypothetical protein